MDPYMKKYFREVTALLTIAYSQHPNVAVSAVTKCKVFGVSFTVFIDEAKYLISLSPSSIPLALKYNSCDAIVFEYPECAFDTAKGSIFEEGDDLTNSLCQLIESLRIECIVL
jgi:hypothetical protein